MAETAHSDRASTVDPAEIERFSRIAEEWWDPAGKFAPLHKLNPVRVGYIRDRAAAHWQRDALSGNEVTGLDAAEKNIAVARLHAEGQALDIDYRAGSAEALAETGAQFDIVLALE